MILPLGVSYMMCLSGDPLRRRITLVPAGICFVSWSSFFAWLWSSIILLNLSSIFFLCDSSILIFFLCVQWLNRSHYALASPSFLAGIRSQKCSRTRMSERLYTALTSVLSLLLKVRYVTQLKRKNRERQIWWRKAVSREDSWILTSYWQKNLMLALSFIPKFQYLQVKNAASGNRMPKDYVVSVWMGTILQSPVKGKIKHWKNKYVEEQNRETSVAARIFKPQ